VKFRLPGCTIEGIMFGMAYVFMRLHKKAYNMFSSKKHITHKVLIREDGDLCLDIFADIQFIIPRPPSLKEGGCLSSFFHLTGTKQELYLG